MRINRTHKIWLGVGVVALAGSGTVGQAGEPQPGDDRGHTAHRARIAQSDAKPPESGARAATTQPAGEAGESGADGLDIRVRFLRNMGLVRGHLLVGDELVRQGRWEDALPHFHHPIEELYKDIAPTVRGQGLRQFDSALKALSQTVQAKQAEAYGAAWKVVDQPKTGLGPRRRSTGTACGARGAAWRIVDQRMTTVDKALVRLSTPLTRTTMQTVMAMLRSAASEYGEAIEQGRIAKPVEYQDSRGFVWHAEQLLQSLNREYEKIDKPAIAAVHAAFAELKTAWPGAVPPAAPVKDHATVLSDISRIELAAGKFLN